MSMVRSDLGTPRAALGAQPLAVVVTHRVERQAEHDRVAHQRLDIDEVAGAS